MKKSNQVFGVVVAAIAFVVASSVTKTVRESHRSSNNPIAEEDLTPLERSTRRQMASLSASERQEMATAFGHLPIPEARARGMELSTLGTRRLSGPDQINRVHLIYAMLSAAPESLCAGFGNATNSHEERMVLIGTLDSASLDQWAAISFSAMQAEIRKERPPVPTSQAALEEAAEVTLRAFSDEEAETIAANSDSAQQHSVAEQCDVARLLYGRITALPASRQAAYARALAIFEAIGQDEVAHTPR